MVDDANLTAIHFANELKVSAVGVDATGQLFVRANGRWFAADEINALDRGLAVAIRAACTVEKLKATVLHGR